LRMHRKRPQVLGAALNRSESGRQVPVPPWRRDPAQCLIQRSAASGVRPSVECFQRTDASAPPAESLPALKNFFAKTSFTQSLPPLWNRTIFGQVFVRGGTIKFSKLKLPPTGGSSAPRNNRGTRLAARLASNSVVADLRAAASLKVKSRPIFRSCWGPSSTWSSREKLDQGQSSPCQ